MTPDPIVVYDRLGRRVVIIRSEYHQPRVRRIEDEGYRVWPWWVVVAVVVAGLVWVIAL